MGLIDVQKKLKELNKQEWFIDANNVTFDAELGKGTSAKVYKGIILSEVFSWFSNITGTMTHESIVAVVAIKVMEFQVGGKQKDKQISDLTQEFHIMTQLRHPHLVAMYGLVVEPQLCMVSTSSFFLPPFINCFLR